MAICRTRKGWGGSVELLNRILCHIVPIPSKICSNLSRTYCECSMASLCGKCVCVTRWHSAYFPCLLSLFSAACVNACVRPLILRGGLRFFAGIWPQAQCVVKMNTTRLWFDSLSTMWGAFWAFGSTTPLCNFPLTRVLHCLFLMNARWLSIFFHYRRWNVYYCTPAIRSISVRFILVLLNSKKSFQSSSTKQKMLPLAKIQYKQSSLTKAPSCKNSPSIAH